MVLLPVNGIEIDFPYEPYGAQIRYMSHVIDALRNGSNALLESPTGTGKTLCLLCASLAWRHTYIAALQAGVVASSSSAPLLKKAGVRPSHSAKSTSALDVLLRPQANAHLAAPRIIFASRTHSQLAQAINELKQTVYKPSMSMLASRDQLCVHPISDSLSGSRLNSMCRRITQKRQCRFHIPIASPRLHENQSVELISKMQQAGVMDIEELRDFGKSQCACPWFLSRAAAQADGCEVLFIPYNYLLDKSIRSTLEIDWSNDIVIIDEAHNLESICADSYSFDLTSSLRSQCDAELSAILESGIRPGGITIPALQHLEKTEQGLNALIGTENRELQEIRVLRNMLNTIEHFAGSARLDQGQNGDVSFSVYPGGQIQRVLQENQGPTADTYELFIELLDRAMGREAEISDSSNQRGTQRSSGAGSSAMKVLQTAIRLLFETKMSGNEDSFRTVVQQSKSKQATGRTLSYWCFKPAIAMGSLKTLNLRCLLLTSGTLSPMDSFAAELGLEFPVRLENPHVVTRAQIWAGIIPTGPDINGVRGARLTSAFSRQRRTL
ncbi:DEAD2 [Gracilaria domingensis]|nr:DEAD2 [Gracilaria domingensis]